MATKRRYEHTYRRRSWWGKKQDSIRDTAQQVLWSLAVIVVLVLGLIYFNTQS